MIRTQLLAETTMPLGAGLTYNGPGRTAADLSFCYYSAFAFADQAGTLQIQTSYDGGATWQGVAPAVAVAANIAQTISTRLVGPPGVMYRTVYVNGATAQTTFRCGSSFTAN